MAKKLLIAALFTLLFIPLNSAFAQGGKIVGSIVDASTGDGLPGANILIVELKRGTASDANGNFSINNVPAGTYTIEATYIGYKEYKKKVTVEGASSNINIALQPSTAGLSEVTVSALGFKSKRDESGTSSESVSGATITKAATPSVLTSLSGKAAGVDITQSSGDPGAGARILIRGAKSLQSNNQPLFVIDGVPVNNSTQGSGVAGVTQQSRINDLNPDNIASVEVLKGPSAAALWGSRAANGVIVITTKQGQRTNGKVNISVNSRLTVNELNKIQGLQSTYGQGFFGTYGWGSPFSWGDRIQDRSGGKDVRARSNYAYSKITQKNSKQVYDHSHDIFQNALSWNKSVALSGGNDDGTFYVDIENLNDKGIVKTNSNYDRTSIRTNVTRNFAENLHVGVNASYVRTSSDRIQKGSNISGLLLGSYRTPPDFNNQPYMVNYIDANGNVYPNQQRSYRNPAGNPNNGPGYNNPFFVMNKDHNTSVVNRIFGDTHLSYDPTSWLNITERLGLDYYVDHRNQLFPVGDATQPAGSYTQQDLSNYQLNNDLIAKASHDFSNNFGGSLLVGFNLNTRKYYNIGSGITDFIFATAPPNMSNGLNSSPFNSKSEVKTAALYSEAKFNLYNQLFFDLTARNESASTYGTNAKSTYIFPSASVAWQFTQLSSLKDNKFLSFGKLRAAWGEAGRQPGAYQTQTTYGRAFWGNGWGPAINSKYYNGGASRSGNEGNNDLKPEITTSMEAGLDLRFFNDRLSLSATHYIEKTRQALLPLSVAPSAGYNSRTANAARIKNVGTELTASAEWLRFKGFSWTTAVNWTHNQNTVTSLSGVKNVFLAGFTDPSSDAVQGQAIGVLYGTQWARKSDGTMNLDSKGFPTTAAQNGVLGDPNPDWRAGITNTFRYKNLSVSAQLDIKQGFQVWNGTKGALSFFGRAANQNWWSTISASKAQNLKNYLGYTVAQMAAADAGSKSASYRQNSDGTYSFRGYVHDFGGGPVVVDGSYFWAGPGSGFTGPAEQFIENGSYVRLRQIAVSYTLSSKSFRNATGLRSIDLGVSANNIALWTKYSGIDPETNLTGVGNGQGLDYFNNPNERSWIFTIRVNY